VVWMSDKPAGWWRNAGSASERFSVRLSYEPSNAHPGALPQEVSAEWAGAGGATAAAGGSEASSKNGDVVEAQSLRLRLVDQLIEVVRLMKGKGDLPEKKLAAAQDLVRTLATEFKTARSSADPFVAGLLEDLEGQVTEALSKQEWWEKWGVHYLPSLIRAHQLQLCNNFKDPGVQSYGGDLFVTLRDEAEETFVALPPPKPTVGMAPPPPQTPGPRTSTSGASAIGNGYSAGASASAPYVPTPQVNMRAYMCAGGG